MDISQPFLVDVRVNLGCSDIDMAEHFLNAAQVSAAA